MLEKRDVITAFFDKGKHEPLYMLRKNLIDEEFNEVFSYIMKFYFPVVAELIFHQKEIYSLFNEIENFYYENLRNNVFQMIEEDNSYKEVKKQPIKEGESNGSKDT